MALGSRSLARRFATSADRLRLALGAGCIPKATGQSGEDAFFACLALSGFGLADGVGGWSQRGVDAGRFSRALLRSAHSRMRSRARALQRADLPGVAGEAFQAVRAERVEGSSTLLLGQLQQDVMSLLNVGDCGVLVLRPMEQLPRFHGGTVTTQMRQLYRSTPMLLRRNLPLQLSCEDRDLTSLHNHFDLVTLKLRKGDMLIAGTDGLFDNVGDMELKSMALAHHQDAGRERSAQALADLLLSRASDAARSPPEFGPGGKLDDIAIIVAEVQNGSPAAQGTLLANTAGIPRDEPDQ
ncbi:unnamed protein product [Effrenium voratum]|nr:unnamed protein product [Effrenium voratum]